jgi:hypothetical protein
MLGSVDPSTVGSVSSLTAEQAELLRKLTGLVTEQVGKGIEPYPGDLAAGPSDLQQQSWGAISDLISGGRTGPSQQAIEKVLGGTSDVGGKLNVKGYDVGEFDPKAIQEWYQNALVKPAMDTWEKTIAPTVQEKFISRNAGSSGAANRAIAGSAEDMMSKLNAQLANALMGEKGAFDTKKFEAGMDETNKQFGADTDFISRLFQGGQADLSRATQVPGMQSQSMDDLFEAIGLGTEAGGTQQGITQKGLLEDLTKWEQGQAYNNPWLESLAKIMGTKATEPVVYGGGSQEGWLSPVSKIIGSTDWV